METVNCNLCGSADSRVVYTMPDAHFYPGDWFHVVKCQQCGLGFVNPRPTCTEITRHYPAAFFEYFDREHDYHMRRYRTEATYLESITGTAGTKRLLDVGCANGDFPRYMRQLGWEIEGVEVASASKPITDFTVFPQEFTQIPVSEPRYDAVTAWAVLEHVHDPWSYFAKAAQVLKPEGLFVFLVTNFESTSSQFLFREDIPRHLYFFTESTVSRYLSRSNFTLVRADYSDKIYSMRPVNWLRYYLFRLLGRTFEWQHVPLNRAQFFDRHHLPNTPVSSVRYAIENPLAVLDRMLMPLYEKYQILSKNYGIVTYVARKNS